MKSGSPWAPRRLRIVAAGASVLAGLCVPSAVAALVAWILHLPVGTPAVVASTALLTFALAGGAFVHHHSSRFDDAAPAERWTLPDHGFPVRVFLRTAQHSAVMSIRPLRALWIFVREDFDRHLSTVALRTASAESLRRFIVMHEIHHWRSGWERWLRWVRLLDEALGGTAHRLRQMRVTLPQPTVSPVDGTSPASDLARVLRLALRVVALSLKGVLALWCELARPRGALAISVEDLRAVEFEHDISAAAAAWPGGDAAAASSIAMDLRGVLSFGAARPGELDATHPDPATRSERVRRALEHPGGVCSPVRWGPTPATGPVARRSPTVRASQEDDPSRAFFAAPASLKPGVGPPWCDGCGATPPGSDRWVLFGLQWCSRHLLPEGIRYAVWQALAAFAQMLALIAAVLWALTVAVDGFKQVEVSRHVLWVLVLACLGLYPILGTLRTDDRPGPPRLAVACSMVAAGAGAVAVQIGAMHLCRHFTARSLVPSPSLGEAAVGGGLMLMLHLLAGAMFVLDLWLFCRLRRRAPAP